MTNTSGVSAVEWVSRLEGAFVRKGWEALQHAHNTVGSVSSVSELLRVRSHMFITGLRELA